jgi:transcriptional regulator with XRE-family HTH domain
MQSSAHFGKDFDARAMYAAMDAQRVQRGLSWAQVARDLWNQSIALNERRQDHPISASTLTGIAKRGDCTCQHALFILRWLGRSPESFVPGGSTTGDNVPMPVAGADRRLRWDLAIVYETLNETRQVRGFTWRALAEELRCSDNQLTGIRTARYAIGMVLMMRIVQWIGRPSASFIYAAQW